MPTNTANAAPAPDRPVAADASTRIDLSVTQILGGALAAVTAAALGSRLGLAGTLVGAAVASIVAGVATSLYTASLRRTQERVRTVWTGRGAAARGPAATVAAQPAPTSVSTQSASRGHGTGGGRRPPWLRMLVGAVAVFGLALVALTGVEMVTGTALSGGHGTTIEQASKPQKPSKSTGTSSDGKKHSATPTASASDTPTDDPSASTEPSRTDSEDPTSNDTSGAPDPSASETSRDTSPNTGSDTSSTSDPSAQSGGEGKAPKDDTAGSQSGPSSKK